MPTTPNIVVVLCKRTQQVTTLLGPTLLGVAGQQCWVRLHGSKSLTGFKLYTTSANKCHHCCGSMQTDATSHNIVGCCWPTMLRPFAWAFKEGTQECISGRSGGIRTRQLNKYIHFDVSRNFTLFQL